MSSIFSVNQWNKLLVAVIVMTTLGACSQMTKHSNTLVFGTNTTIGLKVGKDASQTPTVQIGYNRQEAAFVPLLANTSENSLNQLLPCTNTNLENCHFRATSQYEDSDAYSTIASFGTQSTAGADEVGGSMNVAQYFATGIAAQRLVESGGANVITAGEASKEIAKAATAAADARKAEQEAIKEERAQSRLDAGLIAAKAVLSDPSDNVQEEKLNQLVKVMNDDNCNSDALADYNGGSIDNLINYLETRRKRCLRSLAKNFKSTGD